MNKIMYKLMLSFLGAVIIGSLVLSTNVSADDSAVTVTTITVPIACTPNGTGTTHTATLSPNTYSGATGSEYENGIGKTTLTAICNDDNGFSIYAIGYTGNEYGATNLIGENTAGTIATKAYASGDTTSNWSMKLTKITDSTESYNPTNLTITTGYDDYHAVPDTYTKVAQYKANTGSSTTDTTLGVKLETTYAAFIASNQPADTYVGQVKYTMVHPYDEQPLQPQIANSGCINYFPNGSNVEGSMGCQSISASATSATLLASNFSRAGYGFAGWSNKFDYATNPNQEGIKFYGPQEDITFTAGQYTGTNPGLSLYAVWVKSQGNLQGSSKVATVCNGLTQAPTNGTANLSSVSALTDQRDNETYAIAKLADGNCWMIENLRLESTNSDNSTGALAQGYGTSSTYGNFSGLADAENENFTSTNPPVANSLYSPSADGDKIVIGTNNYPYARMPRYNNYNHKASSANRPQNPTINSATNSTTNAGMYSYGNYYTWAAAIADATHYNTNNQSVTNTSLCPSGWRLPKGGQTTVNTTAEFYILGKSLMKDNGGNSIEPNQNASYGYYDDTPINVDGDTATEAFRKYPNNFLYSGYFGTSSAGNRGSSGDYWSSTARNNSQSYRLNLYSTYVYPGTDYYNKNLGFSIRCIVSPST